MGGFTVVRRSEHSLSDAYFDTPERDLADAKLALRIRGEDGRDRLTLKGDASIDSGVVSRSELELEWSPEALERVIEAIRRGGVKLDTSPLDSTHGANGGTRVPGPTRDGSLAPTIAPSLELAGASGAIVAELDVDRVVFTAGRTQVRHYEVECEAHGGHGSDAIRAVLADLSIALRRAAAVTYSKLALAEHLERLEAEGRLAAMLDGNALRREAYEEIEKALAQVSVAACLQACLRARSAPNRGTGRIPVATIPCARSRPGVGLDDQAQTALSQ